MFELELSAEECEEKAAAVLPETCMQHLESSDWKERISSMETLQKTVEEMKKSKIPCQALVRLLSQRSKETKLQVVQKKLQTITLLAQKGNFSRTSAQIVLENVVEMVGDVLCSDNAKEALTAIAEACSLPWTAEKAMSLAFSQNNYRTQSMILKWISNAIMEFGFVGMEVKMLISPLKVALAAVHPDVQTSAITLLGVIYLYMGDSLRTLIENEGLPLLAQINAELEKVCGQIPPIPCRANPMPCLHDRIQEDLGEHGRTEAIDIGDRITSELVSKLQEKNWEVQKEGLEEIAGILKDARFIQPNIGELPRALKVCLCDSNPTLVQMALRVLQQLSTAIGSNIKQHMKDLGFPLIALFRKSKSSTRAAALAAVNTWAAQTNLLEWLDREGISGDLGKETPFQKEELVQWLAEQLPTLQSAPSYLLQCVPHLYSCLQDSNEYVQTASQAALPFFIMHLGFEKMAEVTSQLKSSAKDHILAILENANDSPPNNSPALAPVKSLSRQSGVATGLISPSVSTSPPAGAAFSSQIPLKEPVPKSSGEENQSPKDLKSGGAVLKDKGAAEGKAQAKSTLKDSDSKLGPVFIIVPRGKEQRMRDEKGNKMLKWNFTVPSNRYVEQLKTQLSNCVSNNLQVEMFHSSFPHHIKALSIMAKHLEEEKEGVISCLDLILKWLTLRFFDTNTWVLIKSLEYLDLLLTLLSQEKYQLMENEASYLFPYLIMKMGTSKEAVLRLVHTALKKICLVYPASKVFGFLMEGVKSKNAKQQVGCLVEMGYLLEAYGLDICEPNPGKALKRIAAFLRDDNSSVCSAVLNILVIVYKTHGESMFKMVGNLSEKHMKMLGQIAAQIPTQPAVPPEQHLCEKPQQASSTRSEATCQQAGDAPSKFELACSQEGNVGTGDTVSQTLPSDVDGDKSRLITKRSSRFKMKDIIHLDTIPESQILSFPNTDNTSHNLTLTIDSLICHVSSGDTDTSMQAIVKIEEILRQSDKVETMSGHINQFLQNIFQQLKFIYQQKETEEKMGKDQVVLLCSYIIQAMLSLFQEQRLAQEATMEVLKEIIHSLLTLLLHSLVEDLEEDQKLIQSINLLLKRILEKSDRTRIFRALLKLLQDNLITKGSPDKFSDLLGKCLWRATRLLPGTISTINLDEILLDVHVLMKALPDEKMRQCTNKLPLRALKTLLHTLCKLKGVRILEHLTLIEDPSESEVEAYLRKAIRPLPKQATNETTVGTGKGIPQETSKVEKDKACDVLEGIFQKICSKESLREGLEELYEYKKKCPEARLEPFLGNLSLFLQSYVKQGLAIIETEQETSEHISPPSSGISPHVERSPLRPTVTPGGITKEDEATPSQHLENLPFARRQQHELENMMVHSRPSVSQLPLEKEDIVPLTPFQRCTTARSLRT
ncbi:PREDICTED: cytoskeleton-associated protein 5-like [Tinamus guttatus]|uniref:cytoskeleton-associated protein 5-like n=1 Tax=Tinamus guttatus TaxID=94827 RepID=UPI00052EE398|nr:PREDICTED: cytoskeleton-associated protein 5-like [Tinamus guttatus]